MDMWELLAFCAIAFAAAPLELRVPLGRRGTLRIPGVPAAAFGPALCLAPGYAVFPALFAVLGRMTFRGAGSLRFWEILLTCVRLPAVAFLSAVTYSMIVRPPWVFPRVNTIPAAVCALAVFVAANWATTKLFKLHGDGFGEAMAGRLGFVEGALAALFGLGLAAYRGTLPAIALIPLPMLALAGYGIAMALAESRIANAERAGVKATDEHPAGLSFVDHLTGLANERYLTMFLTQEVSRATRNDCPISALMLDLDNFDAFNKEFGQEAGDRLLAETAARIRTVVREYDLVARYRSDEFIVILPETGGKDAFDTAERIRVAVGELSPDWLGAEVEVSVSGGLASFPDHGLTPDDLINSAHHALNRAKFGGRNRIFSCYDLAKAA